MAQTQTALEEQVFAADVLSRHPVYNNRNPPPAPPPTTTNFVKPKLPPTTAFDLQRAPTVAPAAPVPPSRRAPMSARPPPSDIQPFVVAASRRKGRRRRSISSSSSSDSSGSESDSGTSSDSSTEARRRERLPFRSGGSTLPHNSRVYVDSRTEMENILSNRLCIHWLQLMDTPPSRTAAKFLVKRRFFDLTLSVDRSSIHLINVRASDVDLSANEPYIAGMTPAEWRTRIPGLFAPPATPFEAIIAPLRRSKLPRAVTARSRSSSQPRYPPRYPVPLNTHERRQAERMARHVASDVSYSSGGPGPAVGSSGDRLRELERLKQEQNILEQQYHALHTAAGTL